MPKNQTGDEPDDIGEPGGASVPSPSVLPYIGIMLSWSRSSPAISSDIGGLARVRPPYSSRFSSLERDLSRLVLVDDGDGDLLRESLPTLRGSGLVTTKFLSG